MTLAGGAYFGIIGSVGMGIGWAAGLAAALLLTCMVVVWRIDAREFRARLDNPRRSGP